LIMEKMADIEKSISLLDRIAAIEKKDLLNDQIAISGAKYQFILAIEAAQNICNHLAARLAKGAPLAMEQIMKAITQGLNTTVEEGIKIEAAGSAVVFASEDAATR